MAGKDTLAPKLRPMGLSHFRLLRILCSTGELGIPKPRVKTHSERSEIGSERIDKQFPILTYPLDRIKATTAFDQVNKSQGFVSDLALVERLGGHPKLTTHKTES